jgi:hypothetical protein
MLSGIMPSSIISGAWWNLLYATVPLRTTQSQKVAILPPTDSVQEKVPEQKRPLARIETKPV